MRIKRGERDRTRAGGQNEESKTRWERGRKKDRDKWLLEMVVASPTASHEATNADWSARRAAMQLRSSPPFLTFSFVPSYFYKFRTQSPKPPQCNVTMCCFPGSIIASVISGQPVIFFYPCHCLKGKLNNKTTETILIRRSNTSKRLISLSSL